MTATNPLSHTALEEFKRIYEEEFGEALSDDDASELGMRVLRLFETLAGWAEPAPGL